MANTTIYPYGQNGNISVGNVIEIDPIFTESPAHDITSLDISNWNNKQDALVSGTNIKTINNESLLGSGNISVSGGTGGGEANIIEAVTFNGTPATITNKTAAITATIPSTLDQIADGSTRKLSNYLPLAGGTMDDDAEVEFTDGESRTITITPSTIDLHSADDAWRVVLDPSDPGMRVGVEDFISYTWYRQDGITNKTGNNSFYNIEFPNKNGTFALTSDIPSAVTESTVSGWGFTKNTGTYSMPSGGIPATDLESAVQTSLGKADTALQSYTETDPTVPSWAKQSTKPAYTASEVGALPDTTVIPTVPTTVSSFTNDANYVKYVLCANEAAYNAISNKDSGTLYLIPITQS